MTTAANNGRRFRLITMALTLALTLTLAACGEEEVATDYTSAHRDGFLDACSRPLDDPRLLSDVCACIYDRIEDEVPFREFVDISEQLNTVSGRLPEAIVGMVADCFVEEAEL